MHRVLIVDTSDQWRELLERSLQKAYHVRCCGDGLRALELIEHFEPDVVVMDLMLLSTDGLSVLQGLQQRQARPKVIVTGRYFSNFITSSLERFQVDHVLLKPCTIQCITERIQEVLEMDGQEQIQEQNPYDYITALLVNLGAPTSQQGFRFLRTGILMLLEDPSQQLTKELYPAIAQKHNTSAANVEKALRTTVASAWQNRREDLWRNYFPVTPQGQIPKPTAGQFLMRLTDACMSIMRRWA